MLACVETSSAQDTYPRKPIRMIVGFPPGGQSDTVARLLGAKLSADWGKSIVIENVTGAAGSLSAERVAKAMPDGYTLGLLASPQLSINPSLYKLAYDPVRDFAPVSLVAVSPTVLVVHPGVPARTVRELIQLAKARPGELTFASSGVGTEGHLTGELLKSVAGLDVRHIPYKGVVAAVPDLLGERVTMMFSPTVVVLPLVREGKLRALAITSLRRSPAVPELPTVAESGYPGFEVTGWQGLLAPAATPATIVGKLQVEVANALALPDLHIVELLIETIAREQFVMRTLLNQLALIQHQNHVRMTNRRKAMCNHKGRPPNH